MTLVPGNTYHYQATSRVIQVLVIGVDSDPTAAVWAVNVEDPDTALWLDRAAFVAAV